MKQTNLFKPLNKYWIGFINQMQGQMQFRFNYFFELCIATIYLIATYFIWNEVYAGQSVLAGFSKEQILVYYLWSGFFVSNFWDYYNDSELSEEISEGTLSKHLTKPFNYLIYRFFTISAQTLNKFKFGIIAFLIGGLILGIPFWSIQPTQLLFFLIQLPITIAILYCFNCIFNSLEFWFTNSWPFKTLFQFVVGTISGQLIPTSFFPDYIQNILNFLPFNLFNGFLVETITKPITLDYFIWNVIKGILWLIVIISLVTLAWKKGLKKYEAYGN